MVYINGKTDGKINGNTVRTIDGIIIKKSDANDRKGPSARPTERTRINRPTRFPINNRRCED